MVFGNYDGRKKWLKIVSDIISKYPENIFIMAILTVPWQILMVNVMPLT